MKSLVKLVLIVGLALGLESCAPQQSGSPSPPLPTAPHTYSFSVTAADGSPVEAALVSYLVGPWAEYSGSDQPSGDGTLLTDGRGVASTTWEMEPYCYAAFRRILGTECDYRSRITYSVTKDGFFPQAGEATIDEIEPEEASRPAERGSK